MKASGQPDAMYSSHGESLCAASRMEAETRLELEQRSNELKGLLSELIVTIPHLLTTFKYFNNSFVFNDKDYLKYLSKEANEVKGLLSVYQIRF